MLEQERLLLLAASDAGKSLVERNRLGQFATPPMLAHEIVAAALAMLPERSRIRYLEPGFGTGSFYSALLGAIPLPRIEAAVGYEIDPDYGQEAARLWADTGLDLRLADFTSTTPPAREEEKSNLVVCNPPYVRHHHLSQDQKRRLQASVAEHVGYGMNGLTGLYGYFMVLSQAWMARNGVAAWLVPSEFMDVNYGAIVKRFLLEKVSLLRIHRFDPKTAQFGDALVSSAIVFFRNTPPTDDHNVEFSFGGTLTLPDRSESVPTQTLRNIPKWTALPHRGHDADPEKAGGILADLFSIKRGLATGCNEYFVLSNERILKHEIPNEFLRPILPGPRELEANEIQANEDGTPELKNQRFLLDCKLSEAEVRSTHPALWKYLQMGVEAGIDQRYLCRHRRPWYSQEDRPPAPFLCTYMGRPSKKSASPFRFFLNHSQATAANVYLLLYPKPALAALLRSNVDLQRAVWQGLSSINMEMIQGEGRIYGGGLHKIEPKELANVPASVVQDRLPPGIGKPRQRLFW